MAFYDKEERKKCSLKNAALRKIGPLKLKPDVRLVFLKNEDRSKTGPFKCHVCSCMSKIFSIARGKRVTLSENSVKQYSIVKGTMLGDFCCPRHTRQRGHGFFLAIKEPTILKYFHYWQGV